MTRFLLYIGVAACCAIGAASVSAQLGGATVEGTITDQTGAVVVNAEVQMLNIGSGQTRRTKTGRSGRYELVGLPVGFYRLSVKSEGFGVASRRIALRRPISYSEDLSLVPGIIESSVTVTAGKGNVRLATEIPQHITVTDQSRIEERRPSSTFRVFDSAPNLTPVIANPALERPRLRGLASNRLLIILDGERLNNMRSDPTSGVSPSVIDVTQLESAEVVSGAGSSLYGSDAMAGVINLITESPVRSDSGYHLGIRFNGDFRTNSRFRRGAGTINWGSRAFALRIGGSRFRGANYNAGNQSISLGDVLRLGQFATDMGHTIDNSVARTYVVWALPAGAQIPNGQAHGFNDHFDLWFFSGANQSLRYRQLNSQHKNLGFSFIATPFDQRTQFNSFRRLDKYGIRYEGRELATWLPRIAVGTYRQKYSFPDNTITSPIVAGSSFTFTSNPQSPENVLAILTGNRSTFITTSLSENKNSITTYSVDAQATFAPSVDALLTTGIGYFRDSSADEFSRTDFVAPFKVISGRASNPDSIYQAWGWFNLLEYDPSRWLRFTGGLRLDRWRTQALATQGFPLSVESALLDASFANLIANPRAITTAGAADIVDLIKGIKGITTDRTVVTGNAGVVFRLPKGVNPYFRWGNSYREPGITERYLLRDFGDSTFSVLVIPNTALRPERGREYDVGVKVLHAGWSVSSNYFVNNLKDFIGSAFGPTLFVPANPDVGLSPISPSFPFHGVLYVQRTNTARAVIRGFELTFEASLTLGNAGTITPYGTLGWLKGSNLTPDESTLKIIAQFFNRSDTPLPLRGSVNDAPLSSITPFRTVDGIRFDSRRQRWFAQYEARYQARVRRADPLDLTATISTQYGTLASLNSFFTQALRGGYSYHKRNYRVSFTLGIENLTNHFYFEHFQTAPAPGRSLVMGTTIELFNQPRK